MPRAETDRGLEIESERVDGEGDRRQNQFIASAGSAIGVDDQAEHSQCAVVNVLTSAGARESGR